jgi:hypothetical protein
VPFALVGVRLFPRVHRQVGPVCQTVVTPQFGLCYLGTRLPPSRPVSSRSSPPRRPIRRAGAGTDAACRLPPIQRDAVGASFCPLRLHLIRVRAAHAGSRAPVDLTGGGRGSSCCCLGDVEGSGQNGGLQGGRPRRSSLP